MSLKEVLLSTLPPTTKVADCGICGSLGTFDHRTAKTFRGSGLRLLTGWIRRLDGGHYAPVCGNCRGVDRPTGITVNDPMTHALGQQIKLKQAERQYDK